VPSYLLRAEQRLLLPDHIQLTPEGVTDWLERTVASHVVRVERLGPNLLAFRTKFMSFDTGPYQRSLAFMAGGEIEVVTHSDGLSLAVRANPHVSYSVIPIAQLMLVLGWGDATALLRWGAGLGGIIVAGVVLLLDWIGLNSFIASSAATLRMLRTRPLQPRERDDSAGRLTSA
jgi:hypothetical protein